MSPIKSCCGGGEAGDITQNLVNAMEGVTANSQKLDKFINGTEEETVNLGGVDTDSLRRFKGKIDGVIDGAVSEAEGRMQDYVEAAKAEADRAALLIDAGSITSGEYNIRKAWITADDIAEGGILDLPGNYLPGRDVLYLSYEGVVCTPVKPLVASSGAYQYEEVGELDELSNQVKLNFAAPAGSHFDMWVVALTAEQYTRATAAADEAEEFKEDAALYASWARQWAENEEDVPVVEDGAGDLSLKDWFDAQMDEKLSDVALPGLPPGTGTYVLKSVDGVLSWVADESA
jgi:hypothetical protein